MASISQLKKWPMLVGHLYVTIYSTYVFIRTRTILDLTRLGLSTCNTQSTDVCATITSFSSVQLKASLSVNINYVLYL